MSRPPVVVHVDGADRLQRTLSAAGRDLERPLGANTEAAGLAAAGARSKAPRRSGFLASTVRGQGLPDAAVVTVGAVYGPPINYGWAAHNIKPNPFLTEGVESTEPAWLGAYRDALEQAIRKVQGA